MGLNLWKILSDGHQILCSLLEKTVLCSWAHLVILLSLPLRLSPQKILRLSDRQTSTSPAHQPSKGDSQRGRWLRPQPCRIPVAIPTLCSFERLFPPSRCCMCPSPRVRLHPCSTGKISFLTPYAACPAKLRDPNQSVHITNRETTLTPILVTELMLESYFQVCSE